MLFSELARYLQTLEGTTSRNTITEILAELFKKSRLDEIRKLSYLLQGRVVPLYEAVEFGLADKFIIRAIALAYGVDAPAVLKEFKRSGDLGRAAETLHSGTDTKLSVVNVYEKLLELAKTSGTGSQEKKIGILADLLRHVDKPSACYLVRIPLDKLRLGFSEMTVLDSLSWMLTGDKSLRKDLEEAFNVRPDIGFLAFAVKSDGMNGLKHVIVEVGSPVLAQLSQRLPNADEMIRKMTTVAVEPKYDGVRVQIHFRRGAWVKTYSRNLENTSDMFPELADVGKELRADEVILDCEAVGFNPKTGSIKSFQETTTRKRKHNIELAVQTVPLKFYVFDIIFKDGKDLLRVPLSERRQVLTSTVKEGKLLTVSPQIITTDAVRLRSYHDEQLKKGLEGAMVKKWNSPYEPGRRGYSWVKFKEEEGKTGKLTDTIDAVVMGYYVGEGKRAGFGIGAFLVGVRSDEGFVTVTKIGTGVSDVLWKELKRALHSFAVRKQPQEYKDVDTIFTPDVWVQPAVVVELAGDDLTKSPTHGAGVAVRFPRLVRIRKDKSPQQVTTVSEISHMFSLQSTHKK